jgi:hypothetical protein
LNSGETGAVFELEFIEPTSQLLRKKFISLNKVTVNVNGSNEKLFVVRDLSSLVSLQKIGFMK